MDGKRQTASSDHRNLTAGILIANSAIKIRRNSHRINHIQNPNRELSPCFLPALLAPRLLISPPVIRIHSKSSAFITDCDSNRRKTLPSCAPCSLSPRRPSRTLAALSSFQHQASSFQNLIGPPVIRILPKSFRISADSNSNRREMGVESKRLSAPDFQVSASEFRFTIGCPK